MADERGGGDMLMRRIIPCLDVRGGRVVKGVRFQNLRDAGDPAECAARYEEEGADEIVILDVSATPEARATSAETVARVREVLSIPLTVGGGVRAVEDAARLLDAGADKVSVNTAAVNEPRLLTELAERFGRQCVVIAIDAQSAAAKSREEKEERHDQSQDDWRVVIKSGTVVLELSALAWAREAEQRGAGEVLLTSWDRDGTRSGYDLELLAAVSGAVTLPVIASGGAAGPEHLAEACAAGADAVLAASIFHDGEYTVREIKQALAARGVEVRLC